MADVNSRKRESHGEAAPAHFGADGGVNTAVRECTTALWGDQFRVRSLAHWR